MPAHTSESVVSNIATTGLMDGSIQDTMALPDGQQIAKAVFGHPESLTFWLPTAGVYHQITEAQSFAQNLWLHFTYGDNIATWHTNSLEAAGLAHDQHMTDAELVDAVLSMPALVDHIAALGYSEAQVLAYAHFEAPLIMLTGIA